MVFYIGVHSIQAQDSAKDFIAKDSITNPAGIEYKNGHFQKIFYGNRNRDAWRAPIKVPVFDMSTTFADLTPVKKGGGLSTKSLRLRSSDGREYVLRSVYKNGRAGVPDRFRNTIYENALQDLRVGAHPYACLLYTSPSPRDATLSRMPSSA